MRFFSISSAFIIIYWNHVKSEMADSYFTLSSSVVVKTDNKVKPILSNRLYRFNNKKTWNDVFDEVTIPRRSGLEKDRSNFSESRTELDKHLNPTWRIWCSKKKREKKEFVYLPTHTQKSWVGFGQTEIFLRMAWYMFNF
jgi:hypothetical protein